MTEYHTRDVPQSDATGHSRKGFWPSLGLTVWPGVLAAGALALGAPAIGVAAAGAVVAVAGAGAVASAVAGVGAAAGAVVVVAGAAAAAVAAAIAAAGAGAAAGGAGTVVVAAAIAAAGADDLAHEGGWNVKQSVRGALTGLALSVGLAFASAAHQANTPPAEPAATPEPVSTPARPEGTLAQVFHVVEPMDHSNSVTAVTLPAARPVAAAKMSI